MSQESPVTVNVRAVDVGYFSVKFTLGRKLINGDTFINTGIFPSLAPRLASGTTMESATNSKTDGCVVSLQGAKYFVGRDSVLFASGREPREVLPDYSSTDKYRALMLGALNYMAIDAGAKSHFVIRHLVLGLPLNTFNAQHAALTKMATGVHEIPDPKQPDGVRRITVERVNVIVQPIGAITNYGARMPGETKDGWSLVIDSGGGTLDWYAARAMQPNWQRSGSYPKSMLACCYAVFDRIDPTWRDKFDIIERIDRAIRTGEPSFKSAGTTYKMADYASDIEAVVKESVDKMMSALDSLDIYDRILFTGGGANLFLQNMTLRYPNLKKVMFLEEDSVFANVKGFQLIGEMLSASSST